MPSVLTLIIISLCIALPLIAIVSLFSYYSSKWLVSWVKDVQRIDDRKDLERAFPGIRGQKLKEIVRLTREISYKFKIKMPEVGYYVSNEINAFATGPAGNTLIAFSSNLVDHMNMEEIRGVVGHELSHLIHYDLRRILLVQGIFDVLYWVFSILLGWLIFSSLARRRNEEDSGVGDFVRFIFAVILFQIITGILRLIGLLLVLWYNRRRELAADLRGAKIVGVDSVLATLRKLLALEKKNWTVDGIDLTEDEKTQQAGEPNSVSLLKFNPEKKSRSLLDLFRTHPTLEERIERLEKLKKESNPLGTV